MKLDSYILNHFFEMLNDLNANYCVMNNYENMPKVIPSDVDFAVDIKTFSMLDSLAMKLANAHNVSITQKIWHGYNKCAYILSPLAIDSYFWLQLDFFVDFSGRGFPNLLQNEIMLSGKRKYKNFYVPKEEVEVPFLLQRRIFKGDIAEKHVQRLVNLYTADIEAVQNGIVKIFGKNDGLSLIEFIESENIDNFKKNYPFYRKRLKEISSENTNLVYRFKYSTWQFIRALYRFYYPTGLSIAFIGKDTPTKREFIQSFDERVSGSFYGVNNFTPKDLSDYFRGMSVKDYWSKVTKRKTLWNLDTSVKNWEIVFANGLFIPKPDVIIYIYDSSENLLEYKESKQFILDQDKSQNEVILKECIYMALSVQATRTKQHLMDIISPTAKIKV